MHCRLNLIQKSRYVDKISVIDSTGSLFLKAMLPGYMSYYVNSGPCVLGLNLFPHTFSHPFPLSPNSLWFLLLMSLPLWLSFHWLFSLLQWVQEGVCCKRPASYCILSCLWKEANVWKTWKFFERSGTLFTLFHFAELSYLSQLKTSFSPKQSPKISVS